ncbi:hypothetical protein PsYK624_026380 [Phanerochaete sordida]|uniref:Uncharacterized protein n=1 Tax=Phanerochaete sordida TaxID=48140 RepID=A0A9P3G1J6_9APHY|nr:hypothetical protein PsYK624_026380 [Phanerochaete sordida]
MWPKSPLNCNPHVWHEAPVATPADPQERSIFPKRNPSSLNVNGHHLSSTAYLWALNRYFHSVAHRKVWERS